MIKKIGKQVLCAVLESQVKRLRRKHKMTVIAVAGSVGKTSTKLAIAHTLEVSRRVIYQTGNYNDRLTVPLVLFGQKQPGLFNIAAWLRILMKNEQTIRLDSYFEMAVLELGTDGPGQMRHFSYLKPDITVVTALTPEHMEYFKTMDAVVAEELEVCTFSKQVLVNADDTPARYLEGRDVLTYGLKSGRDYWADIKSDKGLQGSEVELHLAGQEPFVSRAAILGNQGVKILLAAAATARLAGLALEDISRGVAEIKPFAGRMQILPGINNSTIIDDTYNASPVAVNAGLDVLYATEAPQRIAILGSMNELGEYSAEAHKEVGEHCRPEKLDLVVTIGEAAEQHLAPAAKANGCTVASFASPYEAGSYVLDKLQAGAAVLAEGSQNRVFAEEALKVLLADASDESKLVRQGNDWLDIKRKQFGNRPDSKKSLNI